MDFNSRCKKIGYSYTSPVIATPMPTQMEMKREAADYTFLRRSVKSHSCRDEKWDDFRDKHLWEAWLLSHGVRQSANDLQSLYTDQEEADRRKQMAKMVFTIGSRGSKNVQFEFPRGVTIDDKANIYVADTKNHRVQIFNQCGVMLARFGEHGAEAGEFDHPIDIAVLPNDDIAVAERKNHRVQIFDSKFDFKFQFPVDGEPISMACDREFNIVVATANHTIQVYRRLGKLLHKFNLPKPESSGRKAALKAPSFVYLAVNNKDQVVVSDPAARNITFYKYDGSTVYQFTPVPAKEGLGFIPTGIAVDPLGQLIIVDSLNHVINVYTERGVLKQHYAGPMDNVGAVQSIALGPDGHLAAIECNNNGPHWVKVFRYLDCKCHESRPGSSVRRTPEPM